MAVLKYDPAKYVRKTKGTKFSGGIVAHGPPASGKTRFAATASKFFPKETGKQWTDLDDIIFLAVDQGALDGLTVEKLNIPHVPVREMIADLGPLAGTMESLKVATTMVVPDVTRYLVLDTISELAEFWGEYFSRNAEDKWAVFRQLGEMHRQFYIEVNKVCAAKGIIPIVLSHSKARTFTSETTDAQKKSALAERVAGAGDIGLDIDGAGRGVYTRNASLEFAIRMKNPGGGKPPVYTAHPRGADGFEGKDRLARVLDDTEPCDLQAIFRKIEERTKE